MPPAGIAGAGVSFFGFSATIASVVISRPATEAASCSAVRTTLVGSMMPSLKRSPYVAGLRVVAEGVVLVLEDLADDDRAVDAGVLDDLARRPLHAPCGRSRRRCAGRRCSSLTSVERLGRAQQRDAAARHDALLDRGAGRVERVVDAVLLLLDLDLGRAADADHRDAAGELGQPLLQLLACRSRRSSPRSAP